MELKNAEIFMAYTPFQQLLSEKLPVKVSYELAKIGLKLQEKYKVIEEIRQNLIRNYGDTDPKTKEVSLNGPGNPDGKPKSKNWDKFATEFNELMNQSVALDDVRPVVLPDKVSEKCSECGHVIERNFEVEASVLMALDKFIKVE